MDNPMKAWRIEGFNGIEKIYEEDIKLGIFTENMIQNLLQTLTAKASLDYSEIIGALARRKSKRSNELLKVARHGPKPQYSCGDNPYFTARIININIKIPELT